MKGWSNDAVDYVGLKITQVIYKNIVWINVFLILNNKIVDWLELTRVNMSNSWSKLQDYDNLI
jgi:hypothetical protein